MDGVSGIRTFVFSGKFVSLRKSDRGKTGFGTGRYWIPAAGWLLSLYERNGMGIREYYGWYLGYIFVPFLIVIQLFLSTENRGRRKKKVTVAGLVLVITLTGSGCAAVEPEKELIRWHWGPVFQRMALC